MFPCTPQDQNYGSSKAIGESPLRRSLSAAASSALRMEQLTVCDSGRCGTQIGLNVWPGVFGCLGWTAMWRVRTSGVRSHESYGVRFMKINDAIKAKHVAVPLSKLSKLSGVLSLKSRAILGNLQPDCRHGFDVNSQVKTSRKLPLVCFGSQPQPFCPPPMHPLVATTKICSAQ